MDPRFKWPLTNLCYAGICVVVAAVLGVIAATGDVDVLAPIAGLTGIVGVLYLLAALFGFAKVLTSDDP